MRTRSAPRVRRMSPRYVTCERLHCTKIYIVCTREHFVFISLSGAIFCRVISASPRGEVQRNEREIRWGKKTKREEKLAKCMLRRCSSRPRSFPTRCALSCSMLFPRERVHPVTFHSLFLHLCFLGSLQRKRAADAAAIAVEARCSLLRALAINRRAGGIVKTPFYSCLFYLPFSLVALASYVAAFHSLGNYR